MYAITKQAIEPHDMLFYQSPSVPYDYPAEDLPKDTCQKQLLLFYKCYADFADQMDDIGKSLKCHTFSHDFYHCKKRRDMDIWAGIKRWDESRMQGMTEEIRKVYVESLQDEMTQLTEEFEKTPANEENKGARWRLSSDINQTQWRIGYCTEFMNLTKS